MGRNDHFGLAALRGPPLPAPRLTAQIPPDGAASNHLAMMTNAWALFIRAMGLPLNDTAEPPGPRSPRDSHPPGLRGALTDLPDLRVPAESARAGVWFRKA